MPKSLLLVLAMLACALPASAQLVISEFITSNSLGITDENTDNEDWIEIENTSASTVNLGGWYLTDNSNQPRKWAFPAWTIGSGNRLVVFASEKDRRPAQITPGQDNAGTTAQPRLHTNFKLSQDGEYLALTKDIAGGGVSAVTVFNPYPAQATDVAYGTAVNTPATTFVAGTAPVKALIPTSGNGGDLLGDTWKGAAANEPFDDSAWLSGNTGVGYGDSSTPVAGANLRVKLNFDAAPAGSVLADSSGWSTPHPGTNVGAAWSATNTDTATPAKMRNGVMTFNQAASNQITIPGHADFDATACTISFWMRSAGATGAGSEGAMLFDRRTGNGVGRGTVINLTTNGTLRFQAGDGVVGVTCQFDSSVGVNDNQWHHVSYVINTAAGGTCFVYIDGVARGSGGNSAAWGWTTATQIELGVSHDPYWIKYNGVLDDFRFYNTTLTATDITTLFNNGDAPTNPSDIGLNVQSAMQNVNASAFIRVPFTVATPANFVTVRLTNRWSDGFIAWLNGTQFASHNAPGTPAYNSTATGTNNGNPSQDFSYALPPGLLRAGTNILAIQGLNNTAGDASFLSLPRLTGLEASVTSSGYLTLPTPGTANGPLKTNVGPFISDVTKNPSPRPVGGAGSAPITITAKVRPSLRPFASNPMRLFYRIMYGTEQQLVMTNLGVLPGDPPDLRTYTAQIPTTGLGAGQMIRWRIIAIDNTAVQSTSPEYPDPNDTEQYYGTVALNPTIESNLPVLYWFIQDPNAPNSSGTANARCSIFFKPIGDTGVGRFYDNAKVNLHGQSSSGFAKKSYDFDFNEDNRFEWDVTKSRVKDMNLMTNWGDKSKTHNPLSHEAFAAVGSAHHWCFQVRVQQVTPTNAATPLSHFFAIADMMEDGDDKWLERIGYDGDGSLYKMYNDLSSSAGGEKKTRLYEGKTDLDAFVAGINPGLALAARRQYAYDNMDLEQCVSYFVGCVITSHQDHGHKNYYVYRDSNRTREWSILPWDVDLSWGRNWTDAGAYFTDTIGTTNQLNLYPGYNDGTAQGSVQNKGTMNRLYSLMFDTPEFRKMYLRRLRTVMDSYLGAAPGGLEARVNAMADLMDPPAIITSDADQDRTKWGTWGFDGNLTAGGQVLRYHTDILKNTYLAGRRTFLNSASARLYYTGGAFENIPASQSANASTFVTIQTVDFKPSTNTQEHEFFVIRNSGTEAMDISGWQLTGAVTHTFKGGTVVPAGGGTTEHIGDLYVVKNPFVFRQRGTVPDDNQPAASRYRFVVGPYDGQLSARGETIELRDSTGALVTTKTWIPAPTAAQNSLRITELNYAPTPPTAAETAALPGVVESDFEYIEFLNTGAAPLTLTGAYFEEGITFTFPSFTLAAGARCLVIANQAAFALRYPGVSASLIAGAFAGNLDNNGENLQLMDVTGENILDFSYNNSWFPPSDEGGRTLVVRSATPDWTTYGNPTHWALSGNVAGSPGTTDSDFANVYEGWRWDHFTQAEFPTVANPNAPAALTQNPDGDEWNNFAEYAFGRDPRVHEGAPLTTPSIVNVGGTDYLAITFNRRHKALDVGYTVESTSDLTLGSWDAVNAQVGSAVDLGNGIEQVTFRDLAPATDPHRSIRVRAVKP